MSMMSNDTTVSEFLEEKFKAGKYDLAASMARLSALQEAVRQNIITQDVYNESSEPFFAYQDKLLYEKKRLSKHRKFIEADLLEEMDTKKPRLTEPELEFYERAYTNVMIPRVMGASAKQAKTSFNNMRFKKAVGEAYNARDDNNNYWCHLLHRWFDGDLIRAAHLVPKSLSLPEVGHLFGVEEVPKDFFYDWRLGITLYRNIELGLDQGTIVIIPKPVDDEKFLHWECILVDQTKKNDTVLRLRDPELIVRWQDLDRKELKFLGDNRPARRYLYFRFIMTYLHAKRTGKEDFISKLQQRRNWWPSPGQYLHKSTLSALAHNISGLDLPASASQDTTFGDTLPNQNPGDDAMILSSSLIDAWAESAKEHKIRASQDHYWDSLPEDEMMDDDD